MFGANFTGIMVYAAIIGFMIASVIFGAIYFLFLY